VRSALAVTSHEHPESRIKPLKPLKPLTNMIDPKFLELLRCPETRQSLRAADADLLQQLNARISAGGVQNRGGQAVGRCCDGGLIRDDSRYLYPIWDGIPVLLVDEAIPLEPVPAPVSPGR
jgi:uncharacterized protein YbaR (Trm112 family)